MVELSPIAKADLLLDPPVHVLSLLARNAAWQDGSFCSTYHYGLTERGYNWAFGCIPPYVPEMKDSEASFEVSLEPPHWKASRFNRGVTDRIAGTPLARLRGHLQRRGQGICRRVALV